MKKKDIFLISFVIFIVVIAIFLSTFLNLSPNHELINIFEEWWPENYERIYEVKIKIDGEMRNGIIFKDKIEGFFDARAICLSRNMSLPHQGFEILFSEVEHDEIVDGMFWGGENGVPKIIFGNGSQKIWNGSQKFGTVPKKAKMKITENEVPKIFSVFLTFINFFIFSKGKW